MRSHPGPHVVGGDRLDLVVPQEPSDPGVMRTLGALVMENSPGNGELLPAADLAAGHIGDGYAVGPAPARVNLTIGSNRHAHLHLTRPPHAGCGAMLETCGSAGKGARVKGRVPSRVIES